GGGGGGGGGARRGRLQVAGVPDSVVIAIGLVGVRDRRTVVEGVGNLVPVLILQRMQDKVRLAGPDGAVGRATARGTVGRADPADPVLPRAGMPVAELAGRTLRRAGACRPALDAVACPREHGRPAVALH